MIGGLIADSATGAVIGGLVSGLAGGAAGDEATTTVVAGEESATQTTSFVVTGS